MAKTQTLLQVFVASPSDVAEERKVLEDVINEFNVTWSGTHNVRLELLTWETHTRPGFEADAQAVINKQIGDEYDIFLGIMWGRFGSPTKRAESGTVEEFERTYSRLQASPDSVNILFYFKDAGIPPSEMDLEQLAKVQEFKRKIASEYGGLHHRFETTEEFRTKVRIHLSKLVQDWLETTPTKSAGAATPATSAPAADAADPLANLAALADDDYEEGLLELAERAIDAMGLVVDVVGKMSDATIELGEKLGHRSNEANKLAAGGATLDIKAAKRVSNHAANDLEVFVNRFSVEIPEFHKQHSLAMEAFGKIAIISHTDLDEDPEDAKAALVQIQEYRNALSSSSAAISELREVVAGFPRMTASFNRARRRAVAITDDLLVQFRTAANQIQDVEQLLERMIAATDSSAQ